VPAGWRAPIQGSQWISSNGDGNCPRFLVTGDFTYTMTFDVPSGATNLALTGSFMADDHAGVTLNGTALTPSGTGVHPRTASFAWPPTSAGWWAGHHVR
jgi:hypothetical protein